MTAHSFLKWGGGKRQLLPELLARVPSGFRTYYEPFLGGGALFFELARRGRLGLVILNDANRELVATYQALRTEVDAVIHHLETHANLHCPEHYYATRLQVPRGSAARAARLIYLNRTCFNGLYRVNRKGEFNVPIGRYANPTILDEENLRAVSKALWRAGLNNLDFEEAVKLAGAGDFVYFDPPYVPLNPRSFTRYTSNDFKDEDQIRLRDCALGLKKRGVHVLLSNSSAPRVYELYGKGFKIEEVSARRSINSKASERGAVKEVLIT